MFKLVILLSSYSIGAQKSSFHYLKKTGDLIIFSRIRVYHFIVFPSHLCVNVNTTVVEMLYRHIISYSDGDSILITCKSIYVPILGAHTKTQASVINLFRLNPSGWCGGSMTLSIDPTGDIIVT